MKRMVCDLKTRNIVLIPVWVFCPSQPTDADGQARTQELVSYSRIHGSTFSTFPRILSGLPYCSMMSRTAFAIAYAEVR